MDAIDIDILSPGYAGLLTPEEARFIAGRLALNATLRKQWGLPRQKSYGLTMVAAKAFPEDPSEARAHLRQQLAMSNGSARVTVGPKTRRRRSRKADLVKLTRGWHAGKRVAPKQLGLAWVVPQTPSRSAD